MNEIVVVEPSLSITCVLSVDGLVVARHVEISKVIIQDPTITRAVVDADVNRLREASTRLISADLQDWTDKTPVQNAIIGILDGIGDSESDDFDPECAVALDAIVTEPAMLILS